MITHLNDTTDARNAVGGCIGGCIGGYIDGACREAFFMDLYKDSTGYMPRKSDIFISTYVSHSFTC